MRGKLDFPDLTNTMGQLNNNKRDHEKLPANLLWGLLEKIYEVIKMIKKNIIGTLSVMTVLSSFSFAEQAVPVQVPAKQIQKTISAENKK